LQILADKKSKSGKNIVKFMQFIHFNAYLIQIPRKNLQKSKKSSTFASQLQTMPNTHLVISTSNDLLRVAAGQILYISSDGNYCNIFQTGGEIRLVTFQLGQIERMIADQLSELSQQFVRIGKSLIVNLNYVYYINVPKQQLILVDWQQNRYTLSASKEALKALKDLIERSIK